EPDAVTSRAVTIPPAPSMAAVSSLTAVGRASTSNRTVIDDDTPGFSVMDTLCSLRRPISRTTTAPASGAHDDGARGSARCTQRRRPEGAPPPPARVTRYQARKCQPSRERPFRQVRSWTGRAWVLITRCAVVAPLYAGPAGSERGTVPGVAIPARASGVRTFPVRPPD